MTRALMAAALSLAANMLRNSGKSGLCRPWLDFSKAAKV